MQILFTVQHKWPFCNLINRYVNNVPVEDKQFKSFTNDTICISCTILYLICEGSYTELLRVLSDISYVLYSVPQ
jgi:hypothetical protein